MDLLKDFLKPEFIWILIGLILMLMEFAMPGLIVFFFGVGAIVAGVVCIFADISVNIQLVIFIVTSIGSLFLLRSSIKRVFLGQSPDGNEQIDAQENIGKSAKAIEDITAGKIGKVEFQGTNWNAKAINEISSGDTVTITAQDGLVFSVKV